MIQPLLRFVIPIFSYIFHVFSTFFPMVFPMASGGPLRWPRWCVCWWMWCRWPGTRLGTWPPSAARCVFQGGGDQGGLGPGGWDGGWGWFSGFFEWFLCVWWWLMSGFFNGSVGGCCWNGPCGWNDGGLWLSGLIEIPRPVKAMNLKYHPYIIQYYPMLNPHIYTHTYIYTYIYIHIYAHTIFLTIALGLPHSFLVDWEDDTGMARCSFSLEWWLVGVTIPKCI